MWEVYQAANCRSRPDGVPPKEERDAASREEALTRHPIGTQVKRDFADDVGRLKVYTGLV